MSLKVLEKSVNFLFKKGYELCNIDTSINRHPTEKKYLLRRGFVSTYMKCLYVAAATMYGGFGEFYRRIDLSFLCDIGLDHCPTGRRCRRE